MENGGIHRDQFCHAFPPRTPDRHGPGEPCVFFALVFRILSQDTLPSFACLFAGGLVRACNHWEVVGGRAVC